MRTAAHMVLPNCAEVGSSTEKPPTSLAHSGLNFVGKARTVGQFSQMQSNAVTFCSTADMEM